MLLALAGGGPSCSVLAIECPPPGYDGNRDCGYECGAGGTCCGNPRYYGSSILGTWYPDQRCAAATNTSASTALIARRGPSQSYRAANCVLPNVISRSVSVIFPGR